jgi:hypothetical protein
MTDDVEAGPSIDQNMVQPHVGDDRGGDERQYTSPCHVVRAVGCPKGDGDAPLPLMWGSLWDPRDRRNDLSAQGLDVPAGGELPAPVVHEVQLLAAIIVVTGVRVPSEDILQVPSGD